MTEFQAYLALSSSCGSAVVGSGSARNVSVFVGAGRSTIVSNELSTIFLTD